MKKFLLWALSILFGLSLVIIMFFNAVESVAFNLNRYYKAYEKYGQPEDIGMSIDDLMDATDRLLDYMLGKEDDILIIKPINGVERPVFNAKEQLHMVDVRALTLTAVGIRWGAVAVGVISAGLLFLMVRRGIFDWVSKGYIWALAVFGALFLAVGIYFIVDFSGAFWNFHLLLFNNDLWILDPATSVMIRMFPEAFFNDMVISIILWSLFYIVLPAAAAFVWLRREKINAAQRT